MKAVPTVEADQIDQTFALDFEDIIELVPPPDNFPAVESLLALVAVPLLLGHLLAF